MTYCKGIIQWYIDGSKTSEGIGAGVAGSRTKLSIPMGWYPSISQAEVCVISRCVEINIQRNYSNKNIPILSDDQVALKALSAYETTSTSLLVQKYVEWLNSLQRRAHYLGDSHKGIAEMNWLTSLPTLPLLPGWKLLCSWPLYLKEAAPQGKTFWTIYHLWCSLGYTQTSCLSK